VHEIFRPKKWAMRYHAMRRLGLPSPPEDGNLRMPDSGRGAVLLVTADDKLYDKEMPAEQTIAVLLIAHGSRREEANCDLEEVGRRLLATGEYPIVEVSYLELAQPTIPAGAQQCIASGATSVLMLPYFLSAGTHVTADLERHRRELATTYPGVEFRLCPPLGLHPLMLDIVRDRLTEGGA
jgi:hypothetical protein